MNRIKYPKRSGSQTVFPDRATTVKLEQAANKWLAAAEEEKPVKKKQNKKKRRSRNRAKPGL